MFDKAELKADKVFKKEKGKLITTPKMFILQRMLRYAERQLILKYGMEEFNSLPKSEKAWKKLIDLYGGFPILCAQKKESGKMILVIMDAMNQ